MRFPSLRWPAESPGGLGPAHPPMKTTLHSMSSNNAIPNTFSRQLPSTVPIISQSREFFRPSWLVSGFFRLDNKRQEFNSFIKVSKFFYPNGFNGLLCEFGAVLTLDVTRGYVFIRFLTAIHPERCARVVRTPQVSRHWQLPLWPHVAIHEKHFGSHVGFEGNPAETSYWPYIGKWPG
jgi:hypothetical protein